MKPHVSLRSLYGSVDANDATASERGVVTITDPTTSTTTVASKTSTLSPSKSAVFGRQLSFDRLRITI